MSLSPLTLPGGADNRMLLELPARAENLSLARASVAAFAAGLPFTVEDLEDIKVAVSEAMSNVILHAYPYGGEGLVRIEAVVRATTLEVVVSDAGKGIADVARARQPAFTTIPERMGLGFVLMENFMDEVLVDSGSGRGTKVTLRKSVSHRDEQGGCAESDGTSSSQPPV